MNQALAGCLALCLAACATPRHALNAPLAAPCLEYGWRTMSAEQRVTVQVKKADGAPETRSFHALLAIERPGRFRLRTLGPGSITLFDILYLDGKIEVVSALRDPKEEKLALLLQSIAGDLASVYDLTPAAPNRTRVISRDAVIVREPDRGANLQQFRGRGGNRYPTHIVIDNSTHNYQVTVEVVATTLDETLHPALFR